MAGSIFTRVEIYEPDNIEKPLAVVSVPEPITEENIRKTIKVGVTIIVKGEKKKKKTFTLPIRDEKLKKELEKYVESLKVKIIETETEEHEKKEIDLGMVKTAEE